MYLNRIHTATFLPFIAYNTDNQLITDTNFVEKRDLNNVFIQDKFKQPKYQAFQRYINRESHSLGQNINDFKDFDYNIFMDGLKMVFLEMGYSEHYKKMMKLK